VLLVFFVFVLVISISFLIRAENSESTSSSEWRMYGKYLNHTAYDGIPFTVISGLNYSIFTTGYSVDQNPTIANGYVYIASSSTDRNIYQLNASNISQKIANYTLIPDNTFSNPIVANGFVYIGSSYVLYQLNASNVSQQITNYTYGPGGFGLLQYSPAISNGFLYTGSADALLQLNASNISQKIANFTVGVNILMTPAIANGYVYVGYGFRTLFQLNATNISLTPIANFSFTTGNGFSVPPAVANGFVYIGGGPSAGGWLFQLNASNVSQQIANFTTVGTVAYSSPAVASGYVYIGTSNAFYQLNASNVSQQIANYSGTFYMPTVANGYVYVANGSNYMFQLNASNVSQMIGTLYLGGIVASSPAYARGYIYFGSGNYNVYQVNASNLSAFAIIDTIPPIVLLGVNTNAGPHQVLINLYLNEQGYCLYSLDGGITNKTMINAYLSTVFYQTETLSDGNYVVNAYCNDTAGNRNDTTNVSFTMYTAPATIGGGLPPVTPPPTVTETIPTASPGSPAVMNIDTPGVGLTNITINVKGNISNASLTIKPLNSTTGANFRVSLRRGAFYQAYEINVTGMNNSEITNVTINFKVNKTWLASQNGTTANIYLYRYYNNRWTRLPTTYLSQDSTYYYFRAISPGFSTFVVFFGEFDCEPDTTRCFNNEVQLCLGNSTWLVTEKCSDKCENGKCVNSIFDNLNIIYIGAIIGIISAIILVFYILVTKFSRRNTGKTSKQSLSKFYSNQSRH